METALFLSGKFSSLFRAFIKFGVIGGLGTLINLTVYRVCTRGLELNLSVSSTLAFLTAVSFNCYFNNRWTFGERINREPLNFSKYIKYVGVNLAGLGLNLLILHLVVDHYGKESDFIGQIAGIAAGMVFNFSLSYLFVFLKKGE